MTSFQEYSANSGSLFKLLQYTYMICLASDDLLGKLFTTTQQWLMITFLECSVKIVILCILQVCIYITCKRIGLVSDGSISSSFPYTWIKNYIFKNLASAKNPSQLHRLWCFDWSKITVIVLRWMNKSCVKLLVSAVKYLNSVLDLYIFFKMSGLHCIKIYQFWQHC